MKSFIMSFCLRGDSASGLRATLYDPSYFIHPSQKRITSTEVQRLSNRFTVFILYVFYCNWISVFRDFFNVAQCLPIAK